MVNFKVRLLDVHDPRQSVPFIEACTKCIHLPHDGLDRLSYHKKPSADDINGNKYYQCMTNVMGNNDGFNKMLRRRRTAVSDIVKCVGRPYPHNFRANLKDCIDSYGRETIDPIELTMRGEMEYIRRHCMRPAIGRESMPMPPGNDSITDPLSVRFVWGQDRQCWPTGSRSNIKADFVIRGLYLEQIKAWIRYIPASNFMILSDSDLKKNPIETMHKVYDFVGLPPLNNPLVQADVESSNIQALVSKTWPGFEDESGWSLASHYNEPIPDELRAELQAFFAPHNARLEHFLGKKFGWT